MEANPLIEAITAAVEASPEHAPLRLHLAELLAAEHRYPEALGHITRVLQAEPAHPGALAQLAGISTALTAGPGDAPKAAEPSQDAPEYDWSQAERDLGVTVPPAFVSPESPERSRGLIGEAEDADVPSVLSGIPDAAPVTLGDVGGLDAVKTRINESFLIPMRNAEIAQAFGKSLRGGLLLYGPPGCGKTYIARAIAGELGARFLTVTMTDVLSSYIGETEKNLKGVFDEARATTPTVLFIDEIDALGMKRSGLQGSAAWLRQMVNQLLLELDSMAGNNDGLYVLAATNHPWDLDEALLRPGRLDRTVLVTPPDEGARAAILRTHLSRRPVAGIDVALLAQQTVGFSGADLQHLTETAAEKAMLDSITAGEVQPITMAHLALARREVEPSTGPWLDSARNVVRFSNASGRYNDLAEYLAERR